MGPLLGVGIVAAEIASVASVLAKLISTGDKINERFQLLEKKFNLSPEEARFMQYQIHQVRGGTNIPLTDLALAYGNGLSEGLSTENSSVYLDAVGKTSSVLNSTPDAISPGVANIFGTYGKNHTASGYIDYVLELNNGPGFTAQDLLQSAPQLTSKLSNYNMIDQDSFLSAVSSLKTASIMLGSRDTAMEGFKALVPFVHSTKFQEAYSQAGLGDSNSKLKEAEKKGINKFETVQNLTQELILKTSPGILKEISGTSDRKEWLHLAKKNKLDQVIESDDALLYTLSQMQAKTNPDMKKYAVESVKSQSKDKLDHLFSEKKSRGGFFTDSIQDIAQTTVDFSGMALAMLMNLPGKLVTSWQATETQSGSPEKEKPPLQSKMEPVAAIKNGATHQLTKDALQPTPQLGPAASLQKTLTTTTSLVSTRERALVKETVAREPSPSLAHSSPEKNQYNAQDKILPHDRKQPAAFFNPGPEKITPPLVKGTIHQREQNNKVEFKIQFSPNIHIKAEAGEKLPGQVHQGLKIAYAEFERLMKRYTQEHGRLSYGGNA